MGSTTTNNYKLMGFFEALTLLFVIAKLTGYISWSWWWVFAPVILHFIIVVAVIVILFIAAIIGAWLKG